MHLLLIIILAILISHWLMGGNRTVYVVAGKPPRTGFGCLMVIIVLLLIGSCASHQ